MMSQDFPERDWKIFRELTEAALDRLCARILAEIAYVSTDPSKTNHERYLQVYKVIRERDAELAEAFNDLSRSKAIWKLGLMYSMKLISEEELAPFSESTREYVKGLPS